MTGCVCMCVCVCVHVWGAQQCLLLPVSPPNWGVGVSIQARGRRDGAVPRRQWPPLSSPGLCWARGLAARPSSPPTPQTMPGRLDSQPRLLLGRPALLCPGLPRALLVSALHPISSGFAATSRQRCVRAQLSWVPLSDTHGRPLPSGWGGCSCRLLPILA